MNPAGAGLWTHLGATASRQYGLFSRDQAFEAGFTRAQIDRRVGTREWVPIDTGVYRIAGMPDSWQQRVMAACLAGPAVASHRSASAQWYLPDFPRDIVEVTARRHRRRRSDDVVWHESFHLGPRDVADVDGIPTTRPHRTLIDLAGIATDDEVLERALDDALRRELTGLEQIASRLEQLGPLRRGYQRMRSLLEHPGRLGMTDSTLETRFLQLLRKHDLREPVLQHPVRRINGSMAYVDCAYPDLGIAIELEGGFVHAGRRPRNRDAARQADLTIEGWRVVPMTWDNVVVDAEATVLRMRALLDASLDTRREGL